MAGYLFALRLARGGQKPQIEELRQLAFDGQSGNFAPGEIVTGVTSGAVGVVVSQADGGTAGTLVLTHVTGEFQNNETLTGNVVGSALVDGVLGYPALTPADQVIVGIDAEEYTKSDFLEALRQIESYIQGMDFPSTA